MARTWQRAVVAAPCAGMAHRPEEAARVRIGDPVLLRQVGAGRWWYCVGCARVQFGEEPPADLPETAVRAFHPIPSAPVDVASPSLPFEPFDRTGTERRVNEQIEKRRRAGQAALQQPDVRARQAGERA